MTTTDTSAAAKPCAIPSNTPRHLILERLPTVLARTGLKQSALYRMTADGSFPKPRKIGTSAVAWVAQEVDDWITSRMVETAQ